MFFSFDDDSASTGKPAAIPDATYLTARRSDGYLNLSNRRLTEVPANVWNFNKNAFGEERWWELHCLRKLILSSNELASFDYWAFKAQEAADRAAKPLETKMKGETAADEDAERPPFQELEYLDLSANNLAQLPDPMWSLTTLTHLNLSRNSFQSLTFSASDTEALSGLRWLSFADNRLASVDIRLFGQFRNLSHLNLERNSLAALPDGLFDGLSNLKTLLLGHNKLASLPASTKGYAAMGSTLTELDLGHNLLKELPAGLAQLTSLSKLDFRQNRISSLSNINLSACTRLVELIAFMNAISTFPEWFSSLKSIESTTFAENSISSVPKGITVLTSLKVLDLSANDLSDVPAEVGLMTQLRSLRLEGNALRGWKSSVISGNTQQILEYLFNRLPASVAQQAQPKGKATAKSFIYVPDNGVVVMSKEKLTSFPEDAFSSDSAVRVTGLKLDNNNLTTLPGSLFTSVVQLKTLDVSVNKVFSSLPDTITSCKNLTAVNISRTAFTDVPPQLLALPALKTLEMQGLGLKSISANITVLTSLTKLGLGYNKLAEIPAPVYAMTALQELILDNNSISEIDADRLLQMSVLTILDLNCNDLTELPPRLGLLTSLRVLEIEGNSIRSIKRSIMESGTGEIMKCLRDRIPL